MIDEADDPPPTRMHRRATASVPSHERLGRARIKVVAGPEAGREFQVAVGQTRLVRGGRSRVNDIVLRDDLVSAVHFSLEFAAGEVVLRDAGSTNGVYAGGLRVREVVIATGVVFRVGDSELQLAGADNVTVPLSESDHFGDMYGWSPVMRELFAELDRVAALPMSTLPVLVTGETGTGKELVARGLHARSARANGPFVVLDCTALPRELADAIVFGHTRGAFSGAVAEHAGVFEQADGGTLFIDELGELPGELQPKLLRVLDRGEVCRFNEQHRVRKVDVRIVSATNRDLRRMVAEGRFREDLFFRVLGKHVQLPALRERGDDVVRLAERFLASVCARLGVGRWLTSAAHAALRGARWPGNVRQLQKVIECAAQLAASEAIEPRDLPLVAEVAGPGGDGGELGSLLLRPWEAARDEFQRVYLADLLRRVGSRRGWVNRAAEFAGVSRDGFVKALKRLDLYPSVAEEG